MRFPSISSIIAKMPRALGLSSGLSTKQRLMRVFKASISKATSGKTYWQFKTARAIEPEAVLEFSKGE